MIPRDVPGEAAMDHFTHIVRVAVELEFRLVLIIIVLALLLLLLLLLEAETYVREATGLAE